jgi:hypothetical protein
MLPSYNHEISLLKASYEIGKYVQSFVSENHDVDVAVKPWSNYSGYFSAGPSPSFSQTRKGLILNQKSEIPISIFTPYGEWDILGSSRTHSDEQWQKIMKTLKETLELQLIKVERPGTDQLWAITKWKDQTFEIPELKKRNEYIPVEEVNKIWKTFAAEHQIVNAKIYK